VSRVRGAGSVWWAVATGVLALVGMASVGASFFRPAPRASDVGRGPGRELVVATTGSDKAAGTREAPLRTLGAAAKVVRPGDTVSVSSGTYDERVDFRRSGTPTAPITVVASTGASVTIARGFRVTGDYNVVRGFTVFPGEKDVNVFSAEESTRSFYLGTTGQVQITGSHNLVEEIAHHDEGRVTPKAVSSLAFLDGSYNVVRGIDFHDCNGINFAGNDRETRGSGRHNTISGGTLHHTSGVLMGIEADYSTVEGLDLHDPGQREKGPDDGNAADGINLNGAHITIRDCKIHGIFAQTALQHSDAVQWWNTADDLTIEGCVIGSAERGGDLGQQDQGHIEWTNEGAGASSNRVVIRNNVFAGTQGDYVINGSPEQTVLGRADGWRIVGNTFAGAQAIRGDLLRKSRGWTIADDVFGATTDFARPAAAATIDYNCYVGCDPSASDGPHSFRADTAAFIRADTTAATRFGVDADWRPRASSRLAAAGLALDGLRLDKAGRPRPSRPSIGAYEPPR
jgi:hypothetical protein